MTAYQILLHELAAHGQTTYAALIDAHPERTLDDFAHAVHRARARGIVRTDGKRSVTIVAIGACPCCGQRLGEEQCDV